MLKNHGRQLQLFFVSRALSTFGDEIWQIALPIFFWLAGYKAEQVGRYYSVFAIGTVIGFLIMPRLVRRWSVCTTTIFVDFLQLLIFSGVAAFLISGVGLSLFTFGTFGLILAAAESIWFGLSETLAVQIVDKSSAQAFHRLNYLSSTFGPLLAPVVASGMLSVIGLSGLAIFNALTFIPQMFAVSSLRPKNEEKRTAQNNVNRINLTIWDILSHPHYGPLLGVTVTVKIALLGVLPFIPFLFSKLGMNSVVLGFILAAFSLGSVIGAFTYKTSETQLLGRVFARDTLLMLVATAFIIFGLKIGIVWLVPIAALAGGWFCARYSIEIRAIRQTLSPVEQIPSLVSLQGLFSRVITPIAGVIYGFLFATGTSSFFSFLLIATVIIVGSTFTIRAARGFERAFEGGR